MQWCKLISNIIDISVKYQISDQSTPMVNDCMDIYFDVVDTAFRYALDVEDHWSSDYFFRKLPR